MRIRYKIDNDQMRLRLMNYSNVIDDELIEKMKTIKKIKFNWLFNGNVDNLPNNITHLHFGREFNKPLDNLPVNLIFLELGNSFNQPLDFLPHSLKMLVIGDSFDHPLENLPSNLENLVISGFYKHPLKNLPPTLKFLAIGFRYYYKKKEIIPFSSFNYFISDSTTTIVIVALFYQHLENFDKKYKFELKNWDDVKIDLLRLVDDIYMKYA